MINIDDHIDVLNIHNILNSRLTELHWFYSPFFFYDSRVSFNTIRKMQESYREPVLVLDRNIFSRLINVISKGTTNQGNTKDIAILMTWSIINNAKIFSYYALNEYAGYLNDEKGAQDEYNLFKKIPEIDFKEWFALALGLEKENHKLLKIDEHIEIETPFLNESVDYLTNYAAILHLVYVLRTEKDQIKRFKLFFEWFYNNLKVSRYTEIYACQLFLNNPSYKGPKQFNGDNFDKVVKGCQNQARDLSYLTQLSIDRWWPIDKYEPILISDDKMLGDIFIKGCFNKKAIRTFEEKIKINRKKTSEWIDELVNNHKEVIVIDYKSYCEKIVEEQLLQLKDTFKI